jgi:hypothetical protein
MEAGGGKPQPIYTFEKTVVKTKVNADAISAHTSGPHEVLRFSWWSVWKTVLLGYAITSQGYINHQNGS